MLNPEHKTSLRALVLCALVPAALPAFLSPMLAINVYVVALALASLVGYPIFIFLRRRSLANVWTAGIVGFVIGVVPPGVFMWPLKYPELKSTSSRGSGSDLVYTMIDGVPTAAGWLDFVFVCSAIGTLGFFTGFVFWYLNARRP